MKRQLAQIALLLACAASAYAQVTLTATASPASAEPGATLVTLTGAGYPMGTIVPAQVNVRLEPQTAGAGPSATVVAASIVTVTGSTRRVTFTVPSTLVVPAPTPYRVTVSGTTADATTFSSTNSAALTIQPAAGILSVTPATAQPGQVAAMLIRTQFGNFVQGATDASLGAGVSVGVQPIGTQPAPTDALGNAGLVLVVEPNTLLALVRVSGSAAVGARELQLRQGPVTYRRTDALTIQAARAADSATSVVTLASPSSPDTGVPGTTTFTLSAMGLPSGPLDAAQIRLRLEGLAGSATLPATTITPASVSAEASGSRTITFQVPASLAVPAPTDYTVTLYGSTSNYGQLASGITFLSANREAIRLTPPVTPTPTLTSLSPISGLQGQTTEVLLNGKNTAFTSGQTLAAFGPGISVGGAAAGQFGPVTVLSATQVKAQIAIAPGAAPGLRDVEVRTGAQAVSLRGAFQVLPGATLVNLSAIQPTTGRPGSSVTLTGSGFPMGSLAISNVQVTLTPMRAGAVRAASVTFVSVDSNGVRQVTFTIPADLVIAQPEGYTVSVSGASGSGLPFSTGTPVSLTILPPPRLISVTPNSGQRGQTVPVTITGEFTSFTTGLPVVSFGANITVSSVVVKSATELTASLLIAATATVGTRTVSVSNGAEMALLPNGFAVSGAPISITLTSSTTPATARPGESVTVQAANVPEGEILASQLSVTLETAGGSPLNLTPTGVQNNGGGTRLIRFTLPTSLSVTAPTAYLVSISGATGTGVAFSSGNKSSLTVQPPLAAPTISSVSPNQGSPGQTLTITITGQNTSFAAGITQVSLGAGAIVSNVAVQNATIITAQVTLAANAMPGARSIVVTTGTQSITATGIFTVLAAAPATISFSPSQGTVGQTVVVAISGQNTNFVQGLTQASFGAGITVTSVTVSNSTSLTAQIRIVDTAILGPRPVVVTTGSQVITAATNFQVIREGVSATLTSVSPPIGATGTTFAVTISGAGTHFQQGQSIASFGAGISPGHLTVVNLTEIRTNLTVAADAVPGPRTVTVDTGAEVASLADAFAVLGPEITLLSPADKSFVNTSSITVQGRVSDQLAGVTVNGVPAPNNGGSFTVAIPLSEGNNTVTAVATASGGATSSTSVLVNLDTTPPRVAILTPTEGDETTEEQINVAGNVNDIVVGTVNDQQARVIVNGITAEVSNRSFVARNVPLQSGTNTVQVVARDRVGNTFTASIKVIRVMAPLLRMILVSGDGQEARISTRLPQPLAVRLTDSLGLPHVNRPVFFRVVGNGGRVSTQQASEGALSVEVRTDVQGRAQAFWTLGSHAGAGVNRVEVGTTGLTAPAVFTASGQHAPATRLVVDSGLNQTGAVGQRLPFPFVAVVIDEGSNRVGGVPVSFAVRAGAGKIEGMDAITVTSDPDGRVAATLTLGPQEGQENNEVEATIASNAAPSVVFTGSGRTPGSILQTRVTGAVLDNSNQPIAGVSMKLIRLNQGAFSNLHQQVGPTVTSDSQGFFEISGIPAGVFKLVADGTSVSGTKRYPTLEFDITTVAGQNNTVGTPIYLPVLDAKTQLCVNGATGGTLTLPNVPGFALTVEPGAATFAGGAKHGCISVTPVNIDKVPMTPGFGQQPRFIVTIQPVGTTFNPPAALVIPNADGLRPGAYTEMYSYDHDLGTFVAIGGGQVSPDGLAIRSVPGAGVLKAGWHCGGDPAPPDGVIADCPDCQRCYGNKCVAERREDNPTGACRDNPCGKCVGGECEPDPTKGELPDDPDGCRSNRCVNGQLVSTPTQDCRKAPPPTDSWRKLCADGFWPAVYCLAALEAAVAAQEIARNAYGSDDQGGPGDAYRHALWNCILARRIGANNATLTDRRENLSDDNPCIDKLNDLNNNAVGRAAAGGSDSCFNEILSRRNSLTCIQRGSTCALVPCKF